MNLYETFNIETLPPKSPGTVKLDALTRKLAELHDLTRQQMVVALILYYATQHDGYQSESELPYQLRREESSQVVININTLPIPLQWMLCRFIDM